MVLSAQSTGPCITKALGSAVGQCMTQGARHDLSNAQLLHCVQGMERKSLTHYSSVSACAGRPLKAFQVIHIHTSSLTL